MKVVIMTYQCIFTPLINTVYCPHTCQKCHYHLQKETDLSMLETAKKPKKNMKKEKRKKRREGESKDVDGDIEASIMAKKGGDLVLCT